MTHRWICQNCSKVVAIPLKKIETYQCGCGMHVWIEYKPTWGVGIKKW